MDDHLAGKPSNEPAEPDVITQKSTSSSGAHGAKPPNTTEEAEESLLNISIAWSLDPTTHSFRSSSAPMLRIELTNNSTRPITIYNEHLDASRVLAEGQFTIFDVTISSEVAQSKSRFCDLEPPSKVDVPLREILFHTLPPRKPVVFTTKFGKGNFTPRPKSSVGPEWYYDMHVARGVNGLEVGHHYSLRPGRGWGFVRWWQYGEKDEVMNPPEGKLDGRTVAYRRKKAPHPGMRLKVEDLPDIDLWCVE